MGNWVAPSELSAGGLARITSPNATGAPGKDKGLSRPTCRGGRGGVGNHRADFAEEEERVRKLGRERVWGEMEERIQKEVEAGLARPPRAYGGVRGAWEMVSMD